ncbi:uncharacterized protein PpBr36_06421 [Pyricularia pennisetigena]|uniref:uncharacterized protein n=1 Tax=Pyricularia pennisetigena TaxID=1578925 RepID=UPI00114E9765|nr:uncharacterized protein PpBr36_06421 [Pyricularia pennisetigena]TLS22577.1 hypothetical protein PpBr36_06421 [Pyricularia pennisetigena]
MSTKSETKTLRLGTASPSPAATTAETLLVVDRLATLAADQNVDLLLLPEAFLGGYPRGTSFGSVIGSRSDEGREEFRQYFRGAVDLGDVIGEGGAGAGGKWVRRELDGEGEARTRGDGTREKLEDIARRTGVFVVVGLIERAGGSLYCAVVYVCPGLGIIGKRRKVMPTGSERLVWAQGSPATLRAVTTTIRGVRLNLAAAICWESYMPMLRQALYQQNINLYLAPTADGRDTWLSLMRTIGCEGRCYVVSSNMCVPSKGSDVSEGEASTAEQPFVSRGGSCITGPMGAVLAGPQWENHQDIIYADVDFEDCIRGRLDLDAAGSYSRNDSFKFFVEGLDMSPLPY